MDDDKVLAEQLVRFPKHMRKQAEEFLEQISSKGHAYEYHLIDTNDFILIRGTCSFEIDTTED